MKLVNSADDHYEDLYDDYEVSEDDYDGVLKEYTGDPGAWCKPPGDSRIGIFMTNQYFC